MKARTAILAALALSLGAGSAWAQTAPSNNAVNTAPQNNPNAPAAGANSFSQGEATSRLQSRGYTEVSGLKLDPQGVWRGTAMKDGKSVQVALDYQGNVVAQ